MQRTHNILTSTVGSATESDLQLCVYVTGDRFEQLMLRFTAHVLRVMCLREAKAEGM